MRRVAEDEGFEPSKGCPLHAFQACALGRYANPPRPNFWGLGRRVSVLETMITHRSFVRRYRTELPQDRKVARVGALWRVRGGSLIKGERCLSLYIESIAPRPSLRLLGKSMLRCHSPTPSVQTISTTHTSLADPEDVERLLVPALWRDPLIAR